MNCLPRNDPIAAEPREFLTWLFTDLRDDLADQADVGGPWGPDPETVARITANEHRLPHMTLSQEKAQLAKLLSHPTRLVIAVASLSVGHRCTTIVTSFHYRLARTTHDTRLFSQTDWTR